MNYPRIELINQALQRKYPGWTVIEDAEGPRVETSGGLVIPLSYTEFLQGTALDAFAICEKEIQEFNRLDAMTLYDGAAIRKENHD